MSSFLLLSPCSDDHHHESAVSLSSLLETSQATLFAIHISSLSWSSVTRTFPISFSVSCMIHGFFLSTGNSESSHNESYTFVLQPQLSLSLTHFLFVLPLFLTFALTFPASKRRQTSLLVSLIDLISWLIWDLRHFDASIFFSFGCFYQLLCIPHRVSWSSFPKRWLPVAFQYPTSIKRFSKA